MLSKEQKRALLLATEDIIVECREAIAAGGVQPDTPIAAAEKQESNHGLLLSSSHFQFYGTTRAATNRQLDDLAAQYGAAAMPLLIATARYVTLALSAEVHRSVHWWLGTYNVAITVSTWKKDGWVDDCTLDITPIRAEEKDELETARENLRVAAEALDSVLKKQKRG